MRDNRYNNNKNNSQAQTYNQKMENTEIEEDKGSKKLEKEMMHTAIAKSHEQGGKGKKLSQILCKLLDKLEEDSPETKEWFIMSLYEMANGKHFNEFTSNKVVDAMVNVDGTSGKHFSMEDTTHLYQKFVEEKHRTMYNMCDWYVIMNMMWSDYCEVLGEPIEMYVMMSKAYFEGPDEEEGKAWDQLGVKLFPQESEED